MRINLQKSICAGLVVSLVWIGTANAKPKPPVFVVDDESRITSIDKIAMLPIVAVAELDPKREEKLTDDVRKKLALELALKGYVLKRAREFAPGRELAAPEVAAMSTEELAALGPDGNRYILLCFLNAIETSKIVIAESAETRIAAVLIDKQERQVLWQNEVDESATLSIFNAGAIVMWLFQEDSLSVFKAFKTLFESFPEKPMD